MKIKSSERPFYECKVYIGSIDELIKRKIKHSTLTNFIKEFQDSTDIIIPLRCSKTVFLSGTKYQENGYEISAINYPRINSGSAYTTAVIKDFMECLAKRLLTEFNQKRVSVVDHNTVTMYESEIKYG